jgi:hypothetical protein
MGAHSHKSVNLTDRYVFDGAGQRRVIIGMVVGLAMFALGVILMISGVGMSHDDHGASAGHGTEAHATAGHDAHAAAPADHGKSDAHAEAGHDAKATAGHDAHTAAGHEAAAAHADHHGPTWLTRVYANLWLNSLFFFGIALCGVFFVAINYAAWAGWSAGFIRIPMAFGSYLPVGGAFILAVFLLGHSELFHWTDASLYDKASPNFDPILYGKKAFLNLPFYLSRMVFFIGVWFLLWRMIRALSVKEDAEGGPKVTKFYDKIIVLAAVFIITFAVGTSMMAWDWTMSIDSHWYSTLFGWYHFASWWVSALSTIALTVIYLKEKGHLQHVNENHIHDLGKFMFGFSVFWTYLWFSQFMLIYYANIPEEIAYFYNRIDAWDQHYRLGFFFMLVPNFLFPLLFLMTRASKRSFLLIKIAAFAILGGHYLDFYNMIMPGTAKDLGGFGFTEFGALLFFACLFIYVVSKSVASLPLVPKNHPMLEESIHHDI